MEILLELVEQNPQLKNIGVYDVMALVQKVLKAQKVVDEKIKNKSN
ncbi:hypothetical protein J7E63_15880 [Bacillus sp. ISL-75]|nr:hypothetical protein [Bacillus sp. ISL-75]